MRISAMELLQEKMGLQPFKCMDLSRIVLLTGSNGAGKTRVLKLIQQAADLLSKGEKVDYLEVKIIEHEEEVQLTAENVHKLQIIDYSHYDARLQMPSSFSPYVIHKAKDILKECNYKETALNSLLFIEDMAKGYSPEYSDGECFQKFRQWLEEVFDICITFEEGTTHLTISGQRIEEAGLSPGQQYLLRIAVACFQNENKQGLIFLLDEPELHLHPRALIKMIDELTKKFANAQFWISTHSLLLISYYTVAIEDTTTLYLHNGKIDLFRSNSSCLLDGLVGDEENQFAIQQLFALPDEYACNKFAFECFEEAKTVAGKDGQDVEVGLVRECFDSKDIVVDFGAGQGRFLEEFELGRKESDAEIEYYAFDPREPDEVTFKCKQVMNKYGSTEHNYYTEVEELQSVLRGKAHCVLMVNVMHEIPPKEWLQIFKNIKELLKSEGKLIIVERDELMVGETAYEQGFLMLTSNGAEVLFGKTHVIERRHSKKHYIVCYTIDREGLENIDEKAVSECIEVIQKDSIEQIKCIKEAPVEVERKKRFKAGMKLAFWLHQYANAALLREEVEA